MLKLSYALKFKCWNFSSVKSWWILLLCWYFFLTVRKLLSKVLIGAPHPQVIPIWSTIPVFVVAVFSLVASKQNYVIGSFCMLREPSLCQFFSRPKKSINFQNILMFKRTPKIYRLYPLIHICMFFSPYKKVVQGLFV